MKWFGGLLVAAMLIASPASAGDAMDAVGTNSLAPSIDFDVELSEHGDYVGEVRVPSEHPMAKTMTHAIIHFVAQLAEGVDALAFSSETPCVLPSGKPALIACRFGTQMQPDRSVPLPRSRPKNAPASRLIADRK